MSGVGVPAAPRNSAFDAFILGSAPAILLKKPLAAASSSPALQDVSQSEPQLAPALPNCGGRGFDSYVLQPVPSSGSDDTVKQTAEDCEQSPTGQQEAKGKATRKARRDKQCPKACARCRMMKLKCDAGRPCMGCIRKGCAASCVDWDRSRALCNKIDVSPSGTAWTDWIERPIPFKPAAVVANSCAGSAEFKTIEGDQMTLEKLMAFPPREFLTATMKKLLTPERVADWMDAFDDDLVEAFTQYVKLVSMQSSGVRHTFKMKGRPCDRNVGVIANGDDEALGLDVFPGVAYVKYNPVDNQCSVNEGYCRMMNSHPEEVLSRMRGQDFCHCFTDMDALCNLVDNIQLTARSTRHETRIVSRYYALSRTFEKQAPRDATPTLIHMTIRLSFDGDATLASIEKFMKPISVQDYNLAQKLTPHLCRPLAEAIGDRRSGEELLLEYHPERASSLSSLARIPQYKHRLHALSAFFRERSAALVAHAVASAAPAAHPPPAPMPAPSHWTDDLAAAASPLGAASSAGSDGHESTDDSSQRSVASTPPSLAAPSPSELGAPSPAEWSHAELSENGEDGDAGGERVRPGGGEGTGEDGEGGRGSRWGSEGDVFGMEEGGGLGGGGLGGGLEGAELLAEILNAEDAGLLDGVGEEVWWEHGDLPAGGASWAAAL